MKTVKPFGVVYLITNTVNDKTYIGQTVQPLYKRWGQHKRYGNGGHESGKHLYNAMRTYGNDNFNIEVLAQCDSKQEMDALETLWIVLSASHDSDVGYNKTYGGEGAIPTQETRDKIRNTRKERGLTVSAETIEKARQHNLGRPLSPDHCAKISEGLMGHVGVVFTPETRAQISASNMGRVSPRKGVTLPPEQVEKLRQVNLGSKRSPEVKAKMSAALSEYFAEHPGVCAKTPEQKEAARIKQTGKKMSEETLAKMSAAHKGKRHRGVGFTHSAETRAKMSEAHRLRNADPEQKERNRISLAKAWETRRANDAARQVGVLFP